MSNLAPRREATRLASLRALDVLDSASEPLFEAFADAAAAICGTPIALLSLVDAERQWFKANHGLAGTSETPRQFAFCAHAIREDGLLEVNNALDDERFRDNPLVTDDPGIRFYAGVPLVLSDEARIGTLCVIDRTPRQLTDMQRSALSELARAATLALELRQQEQHALRQAQAARERVATLYDRTPAMLHSVDPEGRFQHVSAMWLDKLGYTYEEVIGRPATEFMTVASAAYALHTGWPQFFRAGRADAVPYEYVRKDGSVLDVEVSAVLERTETGAPLRTLAVVEDVSQRKRAESRLAHSHRRLNAIIEGTNIGTWEWNVQTGVAHFNTRWAEIVGYTLAELEPISIETWSQLVHPDDARRSAALLERHFTGASEFYDCVARMRHKDGHWIWVHDRGRVAEWDTAGKPLWMMGTHADISAEKALEASLRQNQAALERTGSIAQVGGWEVDLQASDIRLDAQAACLLGLPAAATLRLDEFLQRHARTAQPAILAAFAHAETDLQPCDLEVPMVTANGHSLWVHLSGKVDAERDASRRLVGAMQDISRRYDAERALAESSELLEITLQSIGDAVITVDLRGVVSWINPVAAELTGWSSRDAQGQPLTTVLAVVEEDTREPLDPGLMHDISAAVDRKCIESAALIQRDGQVRAINLSLSPIRASGGPARGAVLVFRDVSAQRRLARELNYRASHDDLTGLVNRREFEVRLRRIVENAASEHTEHCLMFIDLDHFKAVNDTYGHGAGDRLLQQIATLCSAHVRKRDTLARLGGDEFAVLFEHCTVPQAGRVARQICADLQALRCSEDGNVLRIGASIGLTRIDARTGDVTTALHAADQACYSAKAAGRNCVRIAHQDEPAVRRSSRRGA